MNVGGGEAADQLVRMMLSGGEVAVRLSGSALKNVLALTMALAKDHKKISGKLNLGKMLRETRDLRQFPMALEQYKKFCKLAKKKMTSDRPSVEGRLKGYRAQLKKSKSPVPAKAKAKPKAR